MKKNPRLIIRRPLITEKSHLLQDEENKYVFEVARDANKLEIKQAIEDIFEESQIKVESVRTMRMQGKMKRLGRFEGRRPNWKKAIIKLRDGDVIELYTGA
jgi:large subunit ribosomal protein L23